MMEYYQGSLREFAEELLANGRGNGQMVEVARLHDVVIEDAKTKRFGIVFRNDCCDAKHNL